MSEFEEKAKQAHRAIREILLRDWDPIGVAGYPEAQNEYDAFVGEVYRLLSRRVERSEVFKYLWWLETEHMALCGDRQRTEKIADRLVGLLDQGTMPGA